MKSFNKIAPFIVIIIFYITGCSSKPSEADGRSVVETTIHRESNGIIKLINFEKTNGQEFEVSGIKLYGMEFKAEIEFNLDCYWGSPIGGFETRTGNPTPFNLADYIGKRQARAGEHIMIIGTIRFEKTEKRLDWENCINASSTMT